MRIRELSVTDYRAFDGAHTFALADRVTVVAGVNGRGKTALLDGLALLLSRLLRALDLAAGDPRFIGTADIHGQAAAVHVAMQASCATIPVAYEIEYTRGRKRASVTPLAPAARNAIVKAYGDPSRADDQAPLAVYYTTDRAGFRLPKTLPNVRPRGRKLAYAGALFNRTVDYRDFMARFRVWQSEKPPRTVTAFYKALGTFLDGFGDVRVQRNPPRLSIRKESLPLELAQFSDGERSFIAMVADLVRRLSLANPGLADPLAGSGVVLIDELELHLHPQWQRTIVEKLRKTFPNLQFVATTHSPFIVQTLREGELILLDQDVMGSYADRGLEEIATVIMGIEDPDVSPRYLEMLDTAKQYFLALEENGGLSGPKKAALKRKLNRLARKYADNPAYQAFLELQQSRHLPRQP